MEECDIVNASAEVDSAAKMATTRREIREIILKDFTNLFSTLSTSCSRLNRLVGRAVCCLLLVALACCLLLVACLLMFVLQTSFEVLGFDGSGEFEKNGAKNKFRLKNKSQHQQHNIRTCTSSHFILPIQFQ